MIALARRSFELEGTDRRPHGFFGLLEWHEWMGWDDGYSEYRFTITRGRDVWSENTGGYDRPVISVTISADSKTHALPQFDRPLVVPRLAELSDVTPVPLDQVPDTHLGHFVGRVLREHGGHDLCRLTSTCLTFRITFDDEPPWVPRRPR